MPESNDEKINSIDENTETKQLGTIKERSTQSSEVRSKERLHAKQLIERYFYQLTIGCGCLHCKNENCASNQQALAPNQAAARAIKLFSEDAPFCEFVPYKTISGEKESYSEPVAANLQIFEFDKHR